jgi:hypothetical protein
VRKKKNLLTVGREGAGVRKKKIILRLFFQSHIYLILPIKSVHNSYKNKNACVFAYAFAAMKNTLFQGYMRTVTYKYNYRTKI